jgi:hypothetical protein
LNPPKVKDRSSNENANQDAMLRLQHFRMRWTQYQWVWTENIRISR